MCNMCCTQMTCTCSTLYFQALVLLLSASDVMVLHCSLYALIGLAQRLALCRDQFNIFFICHSCSYEIMQLGLLNLLFT